MRLALAIVLVSSACTRPQIELPAGEAFVVATCDGLGKHAVRWWQSGVDLFFEGPDSGAIAVAGDPL